MLETLAQIDQKIFLSLNHLRCPLLDLTMPFFSNEKAIYAFFIFFSLVLCWQKGPKVLLISVMTLLLVLISDFVCGRVAKPAFGRKRPYCAQAEVYIRQGEKYLLLNKPLYQKKCLSFPSCHASNVACAATIFSRLAPGLTPIFWGFTLLVGYSRIYIGAHYPLDVLAGYLVGTIIGLLGSLYFFRKQ